MEKFIIVKDVMRKSHRFGLQRRTLEFKIRQVPVDAEPITWVKNAINGIIRKGTEDLEPTDLIGFTFCSKDFARGEAWLRFRPASNVTFDDIWDKISSIYQSNSAALDTETFSFGITTVRMPKGTGLERKYNDFMEECSKRRGIVTIENKDNLCLPRALIVAIAFTEKDPEYRKIRRDIGKLQTQRTLMLLAAADIKITEEGAGIEEIQQFQHYLTNYKIVVYKYGSKGRDVIFEGTGEGPRLNIIYHRGHYNVITSLTSAFCCGYFCEICHEPYNNKNEHRCGGTCFSCRRTPSCSKKMLKILCNECGRKFYGDDCYKFHLNSICAKIKRCKKCFKIYTKTHTCGFVYCKICKMHQSSDHLCYIQPDTGSAQTKDILFVFYDLETSQETLKRDGSLLHVPNLCIYKQYCDECLITDHVTCKKCGVRLQVLNTNDVISPFVHHLLTVRKKFKKVVVIAHNGGGFDLQFVLNYMITKTDLKPDLIMNGTKLILMELENVKFLDSLNYFPMSLSKLPKAFGLSELKKGYFPHLFNRRENQNYVGPIPALEYYDPNNMKAIDRERFLTWYNDRVLENYVFDFQREIREYCISDVDILAQACLKFRNQMLNTSKVCPFTESCTIAGVCNKVYRRLFLRPETIGIIPKGGYRCKDNNSKIAIQWLIWEEFRRGISIMYAAKGPESVVAGMKVDGFSQNTNQVFEFHGCFYHGCPKCFKYRREAPISNNCPESLEMRYDATVSKCEHLRTNGYEVIEMWECEFRELLKNEEIREYTESHPHVSLTPLNPRDALYGGRTGNTRSYYKVQKNEKIKYVDFTSLYPFACKRGRFPIGHPKVYTGEECLKINLCEVSGLIKCRILPNATLYHPVLPSKMNNKLMFVNCRSCGENFNQRECDHSNADRALNGTWVIEEVIKSLEKGYQILDISEIWLYETVQLNEREEGLFSSFINKFIKIKQEASGFPKQCVTEEQRNSYIRDFLQKEDIQLEFSKITENPGLRSLAKLMLNSFWGKFAQRDNQSKTTIVDKPAEFFTMLTNPSIYINTVLPINEHTLIVNWEFREESYDLSPTVNVVIAAYVTTIARLKLYECLEKLQDRAIYYDTDSVVYISKPGLMDLPLGDCIGDLTNELEEFGEGCFIVEFVCGGPKNYAFKVFSPQTGKETTVCKVKGISLNYAASLIVNFASIKKIILEKSEPIHLTTKQITRTSEHEVLTKVSTKIYRENLLKRKFLEDGTSIPYGFKKPKLI